MGVILDGKGKGYQVGVSSDNRLYVSSRSNDRIYYVSRDAELAFSVNWPLVQRVGGVTEGLGYLKYTGSKKLYLNTVVCSTEEPGTGMTKFGFWLGSTVSGGVSRNPININQGSNNTVSSLDCYCDEDGSGTPVSITLGSTFHTIRLSGINTYEIGFCDAVILGTNDVFAIKCAAATTGTKVRATVVFYEAD